MTDDAKNRGHAPIGHGFGHDIGDRGFVWCISLQADVNTVVAHFERVHHLAGIFVSSGW